MKYCNQCGNRVNDNDKFCPECGNKLASRVDNYSDSNSFENDDNDINYSVNNSSAKFAESFITDSNMAWLFIGIICPLIVTVIAYFFVKSKSTENAKKIVIGQIIRIIIFALIIILFAFVIKSGFIRDYFEKMVEFFSSFNEIN